LWKVIVLKATIEKDDFCNTQFKSASSNNKTDILNDVTVTLDNNWDNKHVVCCW